MSHQIKIHGKPNMEHQRKQSDRPCLPGTFWDEPALVEKRLKQ